MRYILVDWARRKRAAKRGGDARPFSLETLRETLGRDVAVTEETAEVLVVLDEALDRLYAEHPRAARSVEGRFFGGMTIPEVAEVLGVSPSTVSRDWLLAQGWLYREMRRLLDLSPSSKQHPARNRGVVDDD
jgi:RNA polymerase sigma factor (TIGR02999 family)